MYRQEILQLLASSLPLAISEDGYKELFAEIIPLKYGASLNLSPKTYQQKSQDALKNLCATMSTDDDITLTRDFKSNELQDNTIAYHRIFGPIMAESWWRFSTKQFERDLLEAEANPNISVHFLHINSPGGEAWFLDRLTETMQSLEKPIFAFVEKYCASAAYYIGSQAASMYTVSHFDLIGCIGTMYRTYNVDKMMKDWGIKEIVVKATKSDLKNTKYENVKDGKTKQLIDDELDPLNEKFLSSVKKRKKLSSLPDDSPILRGETFISDVAVENGLIDGIIPFNEAVEKAYQLGLDYSKSKMQQSRILKYV